MKRTIFFLFFAYITILSCSKSNPSTNPIEPALDPVLKELIQIDTTQMPPYDTTTKAVFLHDGFMRLTGIKYHSYNPLSKSYEYIGRGIDYNYTGNNILPDKLLKTEVSLVPNVTSRSRHFFNYDSEGRLIKDSVQMIIINSSGYDSSVSSIHFTYAANQLSYKQFNYYPVAGSYPIVTQVSEKDSRGNIVREGLTNPWYYYEYDSRQNPLAKANCMKIPYLRSSSFFFANLTSHIEQNNNFSKLFNRTYDASGNVLTSVLAQEVIFTFNSSGFPQSSRRRNYPSYPSIDKYIFYYKY